MISVVLASIAVAVNVAWFVAHQGHAAVIATQPPSASGQLPPPGTPVVEQLVVMPAERSPSASLRSAELERAPTNANARLANRGAMRAPAAPRIRPRVSAKPTPVRQAVEEAPTAAPLAIAPTASSPAPTRAMAARLKQQTEQEIDIDALVGKVVERATASSVQRGTRTPTSAPAPQSGPDEELEALVAKAIRGTEQD